MSASDEASESVPTLRFYMAASMTTTIECCTYLKYIAVTVFRNLFVSTGEAVIYHCL